MSCFVVWLRDVAPHMWATLEVDDEIQVAMWVGRALVGGYSRGNITSMISR